jgi:ubiquinone/menaquinone biosynthesis C-methylase UbiE
MVQREGVGGYLKGLQSRMNWMDELCPQKGGSHVVDDCCGTGNFVAVGVGEWLYDR